MSEAAPLRFGKYAVLGSLGSGAMGTVYLAYDAAIDRKVALKTIRKDLLEGKHAAHLIARFRQEAIAAGRLSHPGIVAVYDYGEDESTAYIVMEYAPGEHLGDYVSRRNPALAEIGAMMLELLDALQYAHDAGVVHRDIKPSNLLVSGRLKITDFGVARIASSNLTQHGATLGTPNYMAPEQYTGSEVDHQADIFASGVLFYELLTRRLPFVGRTVHEVAYKICQVEHTPPSQLNPHLPRGLDAVLGWALAKQKEGRFASARDFARTIADVLALDARPPSAPRMATIQPTEITRAPSAPSLSSLATDATVGVWTLDTLRLLEAALSPVLGPVAGPLIRRNAAKITDREQLAVALSASVDDPAARARLLGSLRMMLGVTPPPTATAIAAPSTIGEQLRSVSQADLDRITQALAGFIGPIAKILVQKTVPNATGYRDLCVRVSERLATPEERARFLKQVGGG